MVVINSFKKYLHENISLCWIQSRNIPFAAWVLSVLFVHVVLLIGVVTYAPLTCRFLYAVGLVMLLSGLYV
jgi:hypothetical protein